MANRTRPITQRLAATNQAHAEIGLGKAPTGIQGFDQISGGGLPKGRTAIVCGGPGCGKTMFGLEFLVRGARDFGEPGVLMGFEETPQEMTRNVASLGFDLADLVQKQKLFLDYIFLEPNEIRETGEYDLEGLFVRLQYAVETIGAKRVLLDTLEALFSGFSNPAILRSEVRRLFRWLKEKGLTTVVTAEQGDGTLTRQGLEEYVSDCVILLDDRIQDQVSTRRMRIVKYRGSSHGADEYPFLIDEHGISVLPVTTLGLNHAISDERVSTGVADLDAMMEGKGYYRGSSVLVSGTAGSGKTTVALQFAEAACRRGERCLYVGLEESTDQIIRNALSVGIDLEPWIQKGLLLHRAWRPSQFGMEMHLLHIHKLIDEAKPQSVVVDPITGLMNASTERTVQSMLVRLVDFLKENGITAVFTSQTKGGDDLEQTREAISSLIDSWILLRDIEQSGERNRCLYVLKSRGMAHSNQLREFLMTNEGVRLLPAYVGPGGVFTGSARLAQEARDKAEMLDRDQTIEHKKQDLERKRRALEAEIEALRAEFAAEAVEMDNCLKQAEERNDNVERNREHMAQSRQVTPRDEEDEVPMNSKAAGGTP